MRFVLKNRSRNVQPTDGAIRYRIRFAWFPVEIEATSGEHAWPRQIIWLEHVMQVQKWGGYNAFGSWEHRWFHEEWMPINKFTRALYVHNNQ